MTAKQFNEHLGVGSAEKIEVPMNKMMADRMHEHVSVCPSCHGTGWKPIVPLDGKVMGTGTKCQTCLGSGKVQPAPSKSKLYKVGLR